MTNVEKLSTTVFFDLDFVSELSNEIYAHNDLAVDRDVFVDEATALVQKYSHAQLFPKLEIDTFDGDEEPKLESSDFTLEELRLHLLKDILRMRADQEQDGYLFTCGGGAWEEPHVLPRMRELMDDENERWFIAYHDFIRDDEEVTVEQVRNGERISSKRLMDLVNDDDTWCVRQVHYLRGGNWHGCFGVSGLSIEHGADGYSVAIPESELNKTDDEVRKQIRQVGVRQAAEKVGKYPVAAPSSGRAGANSSE
jgi:hypothetical protein